MAMPMIDQRVRPAIGVDQALADRREQEHAGRAGGGADAEHDAAALRRRMPGEGGKHDAERAGRDAEADQHAAAEIAAWTARRPSPSDRARRA